MLLWVLIVFLITLLLPVYKESFTSMKDELDIPIYITLVKVQELQELFDAGVLWKDVDATRLQELLVLLDNEKMIKVINNQSGYIATLSNDIKKELWRNFVDLFRVKFYDEYNILLEQYSMIDRVSSTTYTGVNPTIEVKHNYYIKLSQFRFPELIQRNLSDLKKKAAAAFNSVKEIYSRLIIFYKSGFEKMNSRISSKVPNLTLIYSDRTERPQEPTIRSFDNSQMITEYKKLILTVLQKRLSRQREEDSANMLKFSESNKVQPAASLSFFSNIMDKLNILEKKELVPVFTNTSVNVLAVDRYLEPSCADGESLFCSGQIKCTDIYGNEIPNLMKSENNASYTNGKTHSNCGSYTKRIEYKDWINSFSKNLIGTATEIITYDIKKCTISKPWKISGTNTSCYVSVEKAQSAFLEKNTQTNELLVGTVVLLETAFLEDLFGRNPEKIFELNHPNENIQVQRLKYKGNMQFDDTTQDIDNLKKLPKVWVNQARYYKGKITQITKMGYDLVIPDDYGIKVADIKRENIFMPNISYLKVLNETLTDATVNSMPRPMCSGSFSKCSKTPKIEFDPSDTLKKNLIHKYEKASPYLMTSTEISDNCPSTVSNSASTGSLGFSVF